jgi:hypothetical protein
MSADATPAVSVVMPLHDKRATVRRAVDSVLAQSFADFELIVVDDGSTDGSADELRNIDDARLRVFRTARRGPGAARNYGARLGRAPWLAFLDADDVWRPAFLEKTLSAARSASAVVLVFCDLHAMGSPPRRGLVSGQIDDYYDARMRRGIAVSCSSVLLRADALAAIGGFPEDYGYGEDIETWLLLACRGPFYFVADPLCAIDIGTPGTISRTATALERAAGLQRVLDRFSELERGGKLPAGRSAAWRRFMLHQRGLVAVHLAVAGKRAAALRALAGVPLNSDTWRDWARCLSWVLRPRSSHS